MLTVLVQRGGVTHRVDAIDPAWLAPGAPEIFWADMENPGEAERRLLADVMHFHELAVEDAMGDHHRAQARGMTAGPGDTQ